MTVKKAAGHSYSLGYPAAEGGYGGCQIQAVYIESSTVEILPTNAKKLAGKIDWSKNGGYREKD